MKQASANLSVNLPCFDCELSNKFEVHVLYAWLLEDPGIASSKLALGLSH